MRYLYSLLLLVLVSGQAFAQTAASQVNPELVIAGSPTVATTINNFIGPADLPGAYFPQDTSATLYVGASLYTANNDGATSIGVVYSTPGVTAQAVVARTSTGAEALGCTAATPNPPPSDIANAAALSGKIAMIRRGVCSFVYKALAAQNAGAVGVIIYNGSDRVDAADVVGNMVAPADFNTPITIPAVLVPNGIGQPIVDETGSATITVTIRAYTGSTAAEPGVATTESGMELRGANPFRGATALRVFTEATEAVRVELFNVRGQSVATLFDGVVAGERMVPVSGSTLAPGVYFVRATGETFRSQQQITVIR